MTAKVKSVLSVAGDALETAAGYALIAVGIYAALFIDMTGGGSLWTTLRHAQAASEEGLQTPNATRVVKVPTQPVEAKVHEDRILAVFDEPQSDETVAAVYPAAGDSAQRPSAAFTDTPADPGTGKTWKKSLKGELRTFTVYGRGEQTSSASSSAGGLEAADYERPVVASEGSAARAAAPAGARPGIGSRMSRGALSASDSSRNVR